MSETAYAAAIKRKEIERKIHILLLKYNIEGETNKTKSLQ